MSMVFVYGTLKALHSNHGFIDPKEGKSIFVGGDTIRAKLFDLGPFPAITEGNDWVYGEVYTVTPSVLETLDQLEGHPRFYTRKEVVTEHGYKVWAYFMPEDRLHRVKSQHLPNGEWRKTNS